MTLQLKRYSAIVTLSMLLFQILAPAGVFATSDDLVFPLKEISKLECRFQDFDTLSSNCKQDLPILTTDDYNKYASQNGWYNDFTRIYTVLWWSSYKYWWDVWSGGHQGTDIATAKWTPVYSIADWKIIEAGTAIWWGKYVSIEHVLNGKTFVSNYAHLSKITVSKGDRVDVSEKIGEVGSTWNSTGNHLHFQIDIPSSFHPYYYDWNSCPYSYYKITEEGVCFNELERNTYDPLEFLETNGAILSDVKTPSAVQSINTTQTSTTNTSSSSSNSNSSSSSNDIFSTTVYYGYGDTDDVKAVQRIYNKLGYYDGRISGDFSDLEESIIAYQLDSWVLQSKSDDGAGWFGPKTRTQTKLDYDIYVANGWQQVLTVSTQNKASTVSKVQTTEKVSRANLLTREEIEAREIDEFMKNNTVEINNPQNFISTWETKISEFSITTSRGKWFRWNTPGNVSFEYDENKISVFPKSFYNFSDGTRDIHVSWLQEGNTTLKVKIGDKVIQSYSITVWWKWTIPEVTSAKIYSPKQSILWDSNTAVILMKDQYGNNLVRAEYTWKFSIESDQNIEYCIKKWTLSDIRNVYKRWCRDDEYTEELEFDYNDSIAGLVIFDYRVRDSNDIQLQLELWGKSLTANKIAVNIPNWLEASHPYYNEVVESLESGITRVQNAWYFNQDRWLTKLDAIDWIQNTFSAWDSSVLQELTIWDITETLTRWEFLELLQWYTWETATGASYTNRYKDLDEQQEIQVASLLGANYSWKDAFWEWYFQTGKTITRWEATFMLDTFSSRTGTSFVARR